MFKCFGDAQAEALAAASRATAEAKEETQKMYESLLASEAIQKNTQSHLDMERSALKAIRESSSKLEEDLAGAVMERDEAKTKTAELEAARSRLQSENEDLRDQLQTTSKERDELRGKTVELEAKDGALQEQLAEVKVEAEKWRRETERRERQVRDLDSRLLRSRKDREHLHKKFSKMQEVMKMMEQVVVACEATANKQNDQSVSWEEGDDELPTAANIMRGGSRKEGVVHPDGPDVPASMRRRQAANRQSADAAALMKVMRQSLASLQLTTQTAPLSPLDSSIDNPRYGREDEVELELA